MKPRAQRDRDDEQHEDEALAESAAPTSTPIIEPRAGIPVIAPDALAALDLGLVHPLRALLWLLVGYTKTPATEPVSLGGGYRGGQLRISAPSSGEEGADFETAGLRFIGQLEERGGVFSTRSDIHLDESGAIHAFVRVQRARGGVAASLSSYYLFSVLSDGTVVETVQAETPYLDSTERYVCRAGAGHLATDISSHSREVARLCRVRGVYAIATRDLNDVVRQQRHSYRRALPIAAVVPTILVAALPLIAIAIVVTLALWFFV